MRLRGAVSPEAEVTVVVAGTEDESPEPGCSKLSEDGKVVP